LDLEVPDICGVAVLVDDRSAQLGADHVRRAVEPFKVLVEGRDDEVAAAVPVTVGDVNGRRQSPDWCSPTHVDAPGTRSALMDRKPARTSFENIGAVLWPRVARCAAV
jgi:hypothetical protein